MATDFLVKQGKVMGGVRLVTDADVAHQTDLTNIRETGTTSSQAISAGTYFYLNDVLVRAKVDIANGAMFTLNTNYEVVTAGALNELNDAVKDFEYKTATAKSADFTATKNGYLFVKTSLVFTSQQHAGWASVNVNGILVYDHTVNSPPLSSGYSYNSALIPIHKGDIVTFGTTNCTWVTRNFISS